MSFLNSSSYGRNPEDRKTKRRPYFGFGYQLCSPWYVTYPQDISKDRKRAVRKRAQTLKIENGDVFVEKKGKKMRVVTSKTEQMVIVRSCHSDPTSGHFGLTKTWKRVAERFYWKGMVADVQEIVS